MEKQQIKVWDWPIRLFHVLLIATLICQYVTAELLEDAMQWHFYSGYLCIALILFRILWGFTGSYYARFTQFLCSPKAVYNYLIAQRFHMKHSANKPEYIGHNPAGGYSVILMLVLFLCQAISGLFIKDDIFSEGPYYGVLTESGQAVADFMHHNGFYAILAVVIIHISAIVYYKFQHKQNLSKAMITGYKTSYDSVTQLNNYGFHWFRLLLCISIVCVIMYCLIEIWPPPIEDFYY